MATSLSTGRRRANRRSRAKKKPHDVRVGGRFTGDVSRQVVELGHESLGYAFSKRVLDMAVAATALGLTAPLAISVAAAIKLTDRGPVFFRQVRVGRNGREFQCYKLRSMVVDAESLKARLAAQNRHNDPRTFKLDHDPRVTWIGRLLRRYSIDELPQFWNVLRGEMSVVGPRPPLPEEVALYSADDCLRLAVKPGLTCLWQVSGRSLLPFSEQVRLDVEYIRKRNLLIDLSLIARTVPAVLIGRGAS